ncbi:LysM peptidoglycan-binding domain-containing protein [Halovulum sp. GXIMD14793]
MLRYIIAIWLAWAGFGWGAAMADCPAYRVRSGDTLRIIAEKFYGTREASRRIYRANARKIGPNPNLIKVGQVLYIPCSKPKATAEAKAVAPSDIATSAEVLIAASSAGVVSQTDQTAPADVAEETNDVSTAEMNIAEEGAPHGTEGPANTARTAVALEDIPRLTPPVMADRLHLLTGGPFPPFAGQDLPQGGMITELVAAALKAADAPPVEIVFVNDRAAHLDGIMPRGGFALTFPWTMPDCVDVDPVPELCGQYLASDGIYEFVTEFYARADLAWAEILVPEAMAGARVCRPVGYPVDDLIALGLLPDKVEVIWGRNAMDCIGMIDRKEADIASMDAAVTRALVDRISVENPILVLEPLTRIQKLRVLALRGNPRSADHIRLLNAGLAQIAENGRWFEIVSRHLHDEGS